MPNQSHLNKSSILKGAVQSKVRFVGLLHTYLEKILLGAGSQNSEVTNIMFTENANAFGRGCTLYLHFLGFIELAQILTLKKCKQLRASAEPGFPFLPFIVLR